MCKHWVWHHLSVQYFWYSPFYKSFTCMRWEYLLSSFGLKWILFQCPCNNNNNNTKKTTPEAVVLVRTICQQCNRNLDANCKEDIVSKKDTHKLLSVMTLHLAAAHGNFSRHKDLEQYRKIIKFRLGFVRVKTKKKRMRGVEIVTWLLAVFFFIFSSPVICCNYC